MAVVGIPPDQLREFPAVLEHFREFTDNGAVKVSDMIAQVESKDRQCWMVVSDIGQIRAVALTRIMTGNYKTCEITHLTGNGLSDWHSAFNEIEGWAKHMGCRRITATARPGYARIGKKYGLKLTHVVLEKELADGTLPN